MLSLRRSRPKFLRSRTKEIAINFNQSAVFDATIEESLDIPDSILTYRKNRELERFSRISKLAHNGKKTSGDA